MRVVGYHERVFTTSMSAFTDCGWSNVVALTTRRRSGGVVGGVIVAVGAGHDRPREAVDHRHGLKQTVCVPRVPRCARGLEC